MKKNSHIAICLASVLLVAGLLLPSSQIAAEEAATDKPAATKPMTEKEKAVERTRRQVKMLDDIYKGGIVLVTTHYVDGDEDLPAGTAFKKLFESAKKNGWHEVRLLDATGDPYSDENVAVTEFEKKAIKQLKSGKGWVDQVIEKKGKRYLLAATPIPVVMEKCTMCHDGYAAAKEKGSIIGALGYTVPIDDE